MIKGDQRVCRHPPLPTEMSRLSARTEGSILQSCVIGIARSCPLHPPSPAHFLGSMNGTPGCGSLTHDLSLRTHRHVGPKCVAKHRVSF